MEEAVKSGKHVFAGGLFGLASGLTGSYIYLYDVGLPLWLDHLATILWLPGAISTSILPLESTWPDTVFAASATLGNTLLYMIAGHIMDRVKDNYNA